MFFLTFELTHVISLRRCSTIVHLSSQRVCLFPFSWKFKSTCSNKPFLLNSGELLFLIRRHPLVPTQKCIAPKLTFCFLFAGNEMVEIVVPLFVACLEPTQVELRDSNGNVARQRVTLHDSALQHLLQIGPKYPDAFKVVRLISHEVYSFAILLGFSALTLRSTEFRHGNNATRFEVHWSCRAECLVTLLQKRKIQLQVVAIWLVFTRLSVASKRHFSRGDVAG